MSTEMNILVKNVIYCHMMLFASIVARKVDIYLSFP